MKNTLRFLCNSLLIIFMLILTVIYYIETNSILISGILTIFLSTLLIINTSIMIRYINYQIRGSNKIKPLVESFINKYFKRINMTLVLVMVFTATMAFLKFTSPINSNFSLSLFVILEAILLPLIIVEFLKIIQTILEYSKLKIIFKKCNEID